MEEDNGKAPLYYDGSMSPAVEAHAAVGSEVPANAADSEEWRRWIGANPYEFTADIG